MIPTPIRVAARTDTGNIREINEDAVVVLPEYGVAALADGMGGHNAGEVASQLAVETIAMELLAAMQEPAASMVGVGPAIEAANRAIRDLIGMQPELTGMATTVALGCFHDGVVDFGHVGDSRIYRLRDGVLRCLTRDHSMIQELVDQGVFGSLEEAAASGVRNNILTRGIGIDPDVQVDTGREMLRPGDIYLLCSDGLSNMVEDAAIGEVLSRNLDDLEEAGDRLLAMALENGGLDNVSLILVQVAGDAGKE
ncbi:MAG TPA: serine/threonine-protein phosphatase [Sedimenticola sp.]|nr:serine/threonine-protein phosphatase [Sedimenticola sp.]